MIFLRHPAVRSIERYRSIETSSGIGFYSECGHVALAKRDAAPAEMLALFHHAAKATHVAGHECWKLQKDDFQYMDLPRWKKRSV